ncbi:MAG: LacI family DNA-binding transcriptional regulator [Paenibacillus sp.]|uniref:LacI family DNA-binding transcriptional regulator n=1 Tax=Paenibacillus sp. TaxID=58172 RepID=UPI0025EB7500|nr:LacI family DNA-binding transcriptional regulator [Paenibacillus sp.]MBR2566260.1 LacI family DNA-binding transcriptional regulator [Paenibacillus sp.]
MTTIRDVAKAAQVSVATVSRVLNNQGYVSAHSREKVERAIQELNYTPNAVARSLYKKKSKSIGFIIPDISNPFFPQLFRAVEKYLIDHEYTVLLFNSDDQLDRISNIMDSMRTEYVAGAIIVSDKIKEEHLAKLSIPVVAIDRVISEHVPSLTVNNYKNAREAIRYLVSQGCSNIAHVRGPKGVYNAEERFRGYRDEIAEQQLPSLVICGNYDLKTSLVATMELLDQHPEIDGIFAGNDIMAVGVIKALAKLGIQVPDQMKVIGFDGIEWGTTITPELTTMEQPIEQIGTKSGELLLNLIDGHVMDSHHYSFDAKLVVRDST